MTGPRDEILAKLVPGHPLQITGPADADAANSGYRTNGGAVSGDPPAAPRNGQSSRPSGSVPSLPPGEGSTITIRPGINRMPPAAGPDQSPEDA